MKTLVEDVQELNKFILRNYDISTAILKACMALLCHLQHIYKYETFSQVKSNTF